MFLSLKHKTFYDIPDGGRIGTNSLKTIADSLPLTITSMRIPIRGNVDTRIRKMESENLDGIILAYAGVARMGVWQSDNDFAF